MDVSDFLRGLFAEHTQRTHGIEDDGMATGMVVRSNADRGWSKEFCGGMGAGVELARTHGIDGDAGAIRGSYDECFVVEGTFQNWLTSRS